jgi:hypothetical protein
MQVNPYAPPEAQVADAPRDSHGLKRRSVLLMIVFMIISFGFYYLFWWFRRRPGLNRLNSPNKLALWPLLLLTGVYAVQFGLGLVAGATARAQEAVIGEGGFLALLAVRLAVGILIIVQTFKVKDMIEDHAAPEPESAPIFAEQVALSGLMTFFFSIFYLQWAINRYVVGPRE